MRDPNRIEPVLNEIATIWHKVPDLRLGQLILNCANDPKLYYLEDNELVNLLNKTYNNTAMVFPK